MAKNKEYSFADEAKRIAKRFPRRENDPIERRDYKQAMKQLMDLQESARAEMGLVDTRNSIYSKDQSFNNQGATYFDEANRLDTQRDSLMSLPNPSNRDLHMVDEIPNMKEDLLKHQEGYACGGKMKYQTGGLMSSIGTPTLGTPISDYNLLVTEANEIPKLKAWGASQVAKANTMPDTQSFFDANKQYLPSAVSGLSNIGSNLLLAALSKRGQKDLNVKPSLATAKNINLEPQAEQLRRDATTARNIALRNARNLGTNAGQTLANVGATSAAVNRGLGANLASLYGQQKQFNTNAANQAILANQAATNRASLVNNQLGQQGLQDRLGYLSGALGTIPGVMQDINLMNADEDTRNMYLRYLNTLGRNYRYTGDIFNSPIGYQVRG